MTTSRTAPATAYTPGASYLYETGNCGRCAGSGFYSHGTCFGCNGKGVTMTRRAAKALKAHNELVKQIAAVTYGELAVGDKVRNPGTIRDRWTTVTATEADPHNPGHVIVTTSRYGRIAAPADMPAGIRPLTTEQAAQVWDTVGAMGGVTLVPAP